MFNFIKSIFIGIALVIPGLSGSMFAFCTGLYDGIIYYAGNFTKDIKKSLAFLLPIILGCIVGVFASAGLVLYVCEHYSFQSYAFFIGLILGSIPLIYNKIKAEPLQVKNCLACVICLIVVLLMARYSRSYSSDSYVAFESFSSFSDGLTILFAGFLSCFLMMLPGMSGSVVLMTLSQYGTVYNAVSVLGKLLAGILVGNIPTLEQILPLLALVSIFAFGALLGIAIAAKTIAKLLESHPITVYYGILGLILGSAATLFTQGVSTTLAHKLTIGGINAFISGGIMLIFIMLGVICTLFMDNDENDGLNSSLAHK